MISLFPVRRRAGVRKSALLESRVVTLASAGVVNNRRAVIEVGKGMLTEAEAALAANEAAIFRAAAGSARSSMKK